ncbi:hypothetical protein [Microlunatus soli]|uniref:hypothetical protein n=1 Tax=Microlunatus soli TaxID=630515 RepID=UPI0012FAA7CD|nr:hypothetical protein [Microlunatus soli]
MISTLRYSATTTAQVQLRWQPTVETVEEFESDTERYRRGSRDTRYRLPPGGATLLRIG